MTGYDSPNVDREEFFLPEKNRLSYNPVLCPSCRKGLSSTTLGGKRNSSLSWQEDVIHSLQDFIKRCQRPEESKKKSVKDTEVFYCRNKDCDLYMIRF